MLLGDFIAKAANLYLPIEQVANEKNAQSAETDEHGAGRGGAKDDRMSRDRGIHQERCPSCQNHVDGERQHRQLEFPAFDSLGIYLIEDAHSYSLSDTNGWMIPCYRMKWDARLADCRPLFHAEGLKN